MVQGLNTLKFIFNPEFWILGLSIVVGVLVLAFLVDQASREFNLP
jgi:hypothetical protein